MSNRTRLDNRRGGLTFEIRHDGVKYFVSMGWKSKVFEGPPLEVFVHVDYRKSSSGMEAIVRDAAIMISFALQYGAPLNALRDAAGQDDRGGHSSVIGAVLDAMVETLKIIEMPKPTPGGENSRRP